MTFAFLALLILQSPAGAPMPAASSTPAATAIPTPTPTPEKRDPHLIAALESRQGVGMDRTALFDDGTLVLIRGYRGEEILEKKALSREEIAVVRGICLEALAVRAKDVDDPGRSVLGDGEGRRLTLEISDPKGGSRLYVYDDLVSLPLAVGRARGALEDLRSRFDKQDLAELKWDTSALRPGMFLKRRTDGVWYRIVHDDALDHDFELEELASTSDDGSHKLRLFVYRGDLARLFQDPASAGSGPSSGGPARRH